MLLLRLGGDLLGAFSSNFSLPSIVKKLLKKRGDDINVNAVNSNGYPLLYIAAQNGNVDTVKILIAAVHGSLHHGGKDVEQDEQQDEQQDELQDKDDDNLQITKISSIEQINLKKTSASSSSYLCDEDYSLEWPRDTPSPFKVLRSALLEDCLELVLKDDTRDVTLVIA